VLLVLAAVSSIVVSVIYFVSAQSPASLARRVVGSAHGVAIAASYVFGLTAFVSNPGVPLVQWAMWASIALPVALIALSLKTYEGLRAVHALQLINAASIALLVFFTFMAPAFP